MKPLQFESAYMSSKSLIWNLRKSRPDLDAMLTKLVVPAPHRFAQPVETGSLSLAALDPIVRLLDASILPPAIQRSVFRRRLSYVGGRLCAELAMARLGWHDRVIGRSASGVPIWPEGLVGSISHTDSTAYCVVARRSRTLGVGIDSEIIVSPEELQSVRSLCCTTFENDVWFDTGKDALLGTLLFSSKECLYKAIYPMMGRFVDFTEVEVETIDWHSRKLKLRPAGHGNLTGRMPVCIVHFELQADAVHTAIAFDVNDCLPVPLVPVEGDFDQSKTTADI